MNQQAINKAVFILLSVIAVALIWVLLFELNMLLFSNLYPSTYINLVFLPAGIRLIAVLLLEALGVMGLFLGALITSYIHHTDTGLVAIISISLISALNPYVSIKLSKHFLKIDDVLSNLQVQQIFIISFIYAALNSLTHNLYFYFTNPTHDYTGNSLVMLLGDLLGCLIVLYLVSFALRFKKKWVGPNEKFLLVNCPN